MLSKIITILILVFTLVSCQFTETMVLNEDGSGRMTIELDLSEMMAFGGEMAKDSTMVKKDTIIFFKDILEEKKDSILKLPLDEQKRLKAMENYNIHMLTDPEINKMMINVFTDFKNVSEANNLMKGFEESDGLMPDMSNNNDNSQEDSNVSVNYSYKKGVFKRDAYIVDVEKHKAQTDSIKQVENFMKSMTYKLKYTFPRKIKKTSAEDATFSLDGKTIEVERSFLEYLKNPDVMDLEVILEK